LAAKDNFSESEIDKTSFWWAGLCGICHPGGGPTEYDRDGELYYDVATGMFGYENLGMTAADVILDGDYAEINHMTGARRDAPWDVTGVAEPDCLLCHRADRSIDGGKNLNWIWRTATLRAKDALLDASDASVPAYAAAATAGQGWFNQFDLAATPMGVPPMATHLQIDYTVGVANGSLIQEADDTLRVAPTAISEAPYDYACWGCHLTPDLKKRGRIWFDETQDVHYAGFNDLNDADPTNDVPALLSRACTACHPSEMEHNVAKGNATLGSVRDDTDYDTFLTCRECHLPGPDQHPDAPAPTSTIHTTAASHLGRLSCEFCHIPYKTGDADLAIDNATTGATIGYKTNEFLSADPLDPTDPDRSRWYPAFVWKTDHDAVDRAFPVKLLLSAWWGDWDDNGTAGVTTDDVVAPIALWRLRQVTAGAPLPGTTDDNGDTKVEVNTPAEIANYIATIKATLDSYGNPVATNPVLVKGGRIWYDAGGGAVDSFEYHGTGILVESSHPFSINHNVLTTSEALGAGGACDDCHGGADTPVFDRWILVDPFTSNGTADPEYKTVREMLGLDPF
jgi:hypothetical protein